MRSAHRCVTALAAVLTYLAPLVNDAVAQTAAPGGRRTFDRVRAVVGDRVILESTIRRELAAQTAQAGHELSPQEKRRAEDEIVRALAREEIWVQIGKIIGRDDPLAFERQVDSLVQDYMDEQQERFGSFARMNEELGALGTSWQALRSEQRQRILRDTARSFAIGQRFRDGFLLVVTPEETANYYRDHPADFAALESGDVAWISIPAGAPDSKTRAEQAAAEWRAGTVAAAELAQRFGGIALAECKGVRPDRADDPRPAMIKDLVRDGVAGEVRGPHERGESLFVTKLVAKNSQPALSFDDLRVQEAIRSKLVNDHLRRLEGEILGWKANQLLVWPANLLGR